MNTASTTPALMPPPGVRPNLQDPESLNPVIIGVSTIGFVGGVAVFFAMGKAGAGRHQWDVSVSDYKEVKRVRVTS
ncbi:MAG: hypothetical protein Q9171_000449 [Xanthocarpia ochracea]